MTDQTGAHLRALPSLAGQAPALDLAALPPDPVELFLNWLAQADASTIRSAKASQLAASPHVALTFWWQPLVRSVRVRGTVVQASRQESRADFAARSAAARQGVDADDWALWHGVPSWVEFWQGSEDRRHVRIVFVRDGATWHQEGA